MTTADFNATSSLAEAITIEIQKWKKLGLESENCFCVDAVFDEDSKSFDARCSFEKDITMTVYIDRDSDNATVERFWNEDESEIVDAADLLLTQGWVKGYYTSIGA